VIGILGNVRVYLACGVTDMRKGFDGLAARVQTTLRLDRMAAWRRAVRVPRSARGSCDIVRNVSQNPGNASVLTS
jgi:transposase